MVKKTSGAKINKMISLLEEIRDTMLSIKSDNSKLLKLKTRQMIFEKKIASDFFGDGRDEAERKDKVE